MGLIQEPIFDPNVPSCFRGLLAGPPCTSGRIVLPIVPSASPLPLVIIAQRRQPPDDEETEEGTKQRAGLVAILPPLRDEQAVEISADEVNQ